MRRGWSSPGIAPARCCGVESATAIVIVHKQQQQQRGQ